MQTTLARNEKLLLGAIVSFVVLFICLFSQISMKQEIASGIIPNAGFINYEMGRPLSENISEYSLEGRDVDHIYEGLKAKAAAQLADIKTGELKKAELKKKVVAAPKSQAQVKPLPAAATKAVPAPVIAASAPSEAYSSKSSSNNNANRTNYSNSQPDTVGRTAAKTEEIIKSKKTYAQWRTLIFATPTRESIASFIDSYRKGEVTLTEYQLMAQELLLQTGEKYQGLGIYVLRSQPSLQSLSQLTHLSKADLSVPIQTYLNEAVAAYMQESNISVLNQALQTSDKILITKVLNLLNANLPKLSQGDYSSLVDSRNRRDAASTSVTVASFKVLLSSLTKLTSLADSELAALAQQTSAYIQSTNNVAVN